MKIRSYVRKANYYETDRMGIVHHSNYIRYFEESRIYTLEQIGCDCLEMEKTGISIPVVDVYAKYHKSIGFSDEFMVIPRLAAFNGAKMKFEYEILFTKDNSLACTGYSTHCFINESGRPVSIKRSRPDIYEKMKALLEK